MARDVVVIRICYSLGLWTDELPPEYLSKSLERGVHPSGAAASRFDAARRGMGERKKGLLEHLQDRLKVEASVKGLGAVPGFPEAVPAPPQHEGPAAMPGHEAHMQGGQHHDADAFAAVAREKREAELQAGQGKGLYGREHPGTGSHARAAAGHPQTAAAGADNEDGAGSVRPPPHAGFPPKRLPSHKREGKRVSGMP